jgi:hypothetical protein
MAHPFASQRQSKVEHSRVAGITKAYATGGAVKPPQMLKPKTTIMKAEGGPVSARLDRPGRASGGRVGKATTVNVIVAPTPSGAAEGAAPPPMAAPKPPMGAAPPPPPGMPMGGPPPGGPPMPMRANGGAVKSPKGDVKPLPMTPSQRASFQKRWQNADSDDALDRIGKDAAKYGVDTSTYRARGGAVKSKGAGVFAEGKREGTKVQHADGKDDGKDIGRGKPITYKTGGRVEAPRAVDAPHAKGGGGGGLSRIDKQHNPSKYKC